MTSDPGSRTNYFADHVGIEVDEARDGYSRCTADVVDELTNSGEIVHGGVLFSMADTGMWAALAPGLADDEFCTTVEAKIQYVRPATGGRMVCDTTVVHRGGSIAYLESEIECGGELVAVATGTYFIGRR